MKQKNDQEVQVSSSTPAFCLEFQVFIHVCRTTNGTNKVLKKWLQIFLDIYMVKNTKRTSFPWCQSVVCRLHVSLWIYSPQFRFERDDSSQDSSGWALVLSSRSSLTWGESFQPLMTFFKHNTFSPWKLLYFSIFFSL